MSRVSLLLYFVAITSAVSGDQDKCTDPCYCNKPGQQYSCGNGNCVCTGELACCTRKNLTYIPELPKNITAVDFSHNRLHTVSAETFTNISHLAVAKLILRHNGIINITEDSFTEFPYIETIDLRGNDEVNQWQLAKSFASIQKNKALALVLDECGLTEIPDGFFDGLIDSMLVNISLQKNQMKKYNESQFQLLKHLNTLDLSNNWIDEILPTKTDYRVGHDTVENLTLSDNNFLKFPPWFCTNESKSLYPNLKFLDLSSNVIVFPVRKAWTCLKQLRKLSLSKNVLWTFRNDIFGDLKSLEELDVSSMVRSIKIIETRAFNIPWLRTLKFNDNHLKFKENSDIPFAELFKNLTNLRKIHLESNDFRMSHESIIQMLEPLENLEHLHLGDINLESIPDGLLNKFPNLTVLNLSKNRISIINPTAFANVTKLKDIFLYENRISEVDETSFPDDVLNSLKVINLADNPFSCVPCKNMWFRKWLDEIDARVLGWPWNYTCHSPACMRGKTLKSYQPKPEDCKEKNPLIPVYISLAVFVVLVTTLGVAVYRGRWYLRYWIYKIRRRHKLSNNNNPETRGLLEDQVIYDAYVIYHDTDCAFIRNTLVPFMENQHGYRLFISDREPEQGAKVDIMVENIYRSNHVIAVISRQFLKDQWCEFQLSITLDRQVELKKNYLLLLTLEDVDKTLLSKSWCVLLTRTPTVEWCDERNHIKRKLFEHQITTMIPCMGAKQITINSDTDPSLSDLK